MTQRNSANKLDKQDKQTLQEAVFVAKGFVKNAIGNKYNRLSEIDNLKLWFTDSTMKSIMKWCTMYLEHKLDKPFLILVGNGSVGKTTLITYLIRKIIEARYYDEVQCI